MTQEFVHYSRANVATACNLSLEGRHLRSTTVHQFITCPDCLWAFGLGHLLVLDDPEEEHKITEPAYPGDAGYDLIVKETVTILAASFKPVPLYGQIAIPPGYWGLLTARSGVNVGGQLLVLPGVIDAGYRGPLYALVHNLSPLPVVLEKGWRAVQLILLPTHTPPILHVGQLTESVRGNRGFGSSGGNGDQGK